MSAMSRPEFFQSYLAGAEIESVYVDSEITYLIVRNRKGKDLLITIPGGWSFVPMSIEGSSPPAAKASEA
jgi:hypothetical protein